MNLVEAFCVKQKLCYTVISLNPDHPIWGSNQELFFFCEASHCATYGKLSIMKLGGATLARCITSWSFL